MTEKIKLIKDSKTIRWIVLIIVSFVMATNYYFYDALSSIKSTMMAELDFTNIEYGLIVSFYSFPNTFLLMAIFGGIILDKWGIRFTGILFITFMVGGAFITAYGASEMYSNGGFGYGFLSSFWTDYSPELKMMILGRLFFGLGAETSIVVINKVLVKWFKNNNLALAFAINVAIARIGTMMALILSPVLVESETGWSTAVWFAAMLVAIGLISYFAYVMYDMKFDKQESESQKDKSLIDDDEEFHFADIFKLFTNKSFLYVSALCVTFYAAVFPFLAYAPDLFVNKYGMEEGFSGQITSLLPFGTIFFTPLFGWYVDKKGKAASLMIAGSALLIIVHLTLALTSVAPYIPIILLGIAFSLVPAAMWPSVAKLVKESQLGTAYGVMTSIQNLGLFAIPLLAGTLLDSSNKGVTAEMVKAGTGNFDYTSTMLMFSVLGVFGLFFAFMLKREDKTSGFGLESAADN